MSAIGDELTALDWIAVVVGVVIVLLLTLAFPLSWEPTFAGMYKDFGGTLPSSTRFLLQRWPTVVVGLLAAALLAAALLRERALPARRALIVAGFCVGAAGMAAAWWALYAPIWQLAAAIQ